MDDLGTNMMNKFRYRKLSGKITIQTAARVPQPMKLISAAKPSIADIDGYTLALCNIKRKCVPMHNVNKASSIHVVEGKRVTILTTPIRHFWQGLYPYYRFMTTNENNLHTYK